MRHFFTLGAVLVAVGACGGTTTIGEGRRGVDADSGSATASGTTTAANAGRAGTQTGGTNGGSVGQGGAFGGTTSGTGFAGSATTTKCATAADCLTPGSCRACPDGSQVCDDLVCQNGTCATLDIFKGCPSANQCDPVFCPPTDKRGVGCCLTAAGPCGVDYGMGCVNGTQVGNECATDNDCPIPPMLCVPCTDGTCAPTHTRCSAGKCDSGYDTCPSALHWYRTCAVQFPCKDPPPPTGVAACDPGLGEEENGPCQKDGMQCDPGLGCGILLQCSLPTPKPICPH